MTEEEIAALVEEARALVRVSDGETGIMLDRLVTALPRLLAEREALRAALKKIAAGFGVYGLQAHEYKQIARAALGGAENGQ